MKKLKIGMAILVALATTSFTIASKSDAFRGKNAKFIDAGCYANVTSPSGPFGPNGTCRSTGNPIGQSLTAATNTKIPTTDCPGAANFVCCYQFNGTTVTAIVCKQTQN